MKVCYPGTFDPITKGHLDIIIRASKQFEEVVVLVMSNPNKKSLFTKEERKELIDLSLEEYQLSNVTVVIGEGLTVEKVKELGATALIRGIRAVSDYEYELIQATANMQLDASIETIFFIAQPKYSFLSSSIVKEIASYGKDISDFVPEVITERILNRLHQ